MSLSKKTWFAIYSEFPINKELDGDIKLELTEMEDLTDKDYQEVFKFLDEMFPDDMADFNETHLPKCQFLEEFYNQDMTYGLADLFRSMGYAVGIPKEYYTTRKEIEGDTDSIDN